MGACYEYIEIEEDGPKVEELEEKEINVIHCSPSHHYPTGRVMPISKRYELLGWVTRKKDRYIIEDEYDSELRLNGKPIPSLQSIDVSGKSDLYEYIFQDFVFNSANQLYGAAG